jgi:hypothetical protein
MFWSGRVKSFSVPTVTVAAIVGAALALGGAINISSAPHLHPPPETAASPGITLGLTAQARQSMQQNGSAFPEADAGFSAYYRVPDAGGSGLNKQAIDQSLLDQPRPFSPRTGPAELLDMGGNYTLAGVPIRNIDGLVTPVNLYYDDQGWLVAYLPRGSGGARAWQAVDLNTDRPVLTDISRTTLQDAINEVLEAALNLPPLGPNDLGYYHWEHPLATHFLMLATARGTQGSDYVSFAVPGSFTMWEVSVSMWIAGEDMPCARTWLNGVNLTGDQCNRGMHHVFANLSEFNSRTAHNLQLDHFGQPQDKGASGALALLVYSAP